MKKLIIISVVFSTITLGCSVSDISRNNAADPKASNYSGGSSAGGVATGQSYYFAFVSNATMNGNFQAGTPPSAASCNQANVHDKMNCACQTYAAAGGLKNPTKYKAMLSTNTGDAPCNLNGNTSGTYPGCMGSFNPGPYHVPAAGGAQGAKVADSLTAMIGSSVTLSAALDKDQFGNTASGIDAWTGTVATTGVKSGVYCLNGSSWNSNGSPAPMGDLGDFTTTSSTWLAASSGSCGSFAHIYCFEVP